MFCLGEQLTLARMHQGPVYTVPVQFLTVAECVTDQPVYTAPKHFLPLLFGTISAP